MKVCEQLRDSNFKNYGCDDISFDDYNFFECPNRMDKKKVLFESPPISVKKATKNGINFNTELSFDDDYIYCGKYNFTYEDFNQVRQNHGTDNCYMADGRQITIGDLWASLLTDFSFNMTKKMNKL